MASIKINVNAMRIMAEGLVKPLKKGLCPTILQKAAVHRL